MAAQKQRATEGVAAVAREPGKERAHEKYQRLIDERKTLPPTPTAVVHACDQSSLQGAVDAARMGLIAPILVGPLAGIEELARQNKIDSSGLPTVDAPFTQSTIPRRQAASY
jgi:phosphate acetyltransferase